MRFNLALLTTVAVTIASPVSAQLLPQVPIVDPVVTPIVDPIIDNPIIPDPITVDPPPVVTPILNPIDVDPIIINPDVQDIVAPIIPDTVTLPSTPITLPSVGEVIDLTEDLTTPILDGVGNTIDDVVTGSPVTLPTGEQIIPLIDPLTQDVVGSIDPVTGAIATPDGEVVGNVTNQGGAGGSGSGSGTGGSSSGGMAQNRVNVDNRNTFIAIPQPALGNEGKTTTETIEEVDERGNVRSRVITSGYVRSVPTLSVSGGVFGSEGLGLIQLAIPLK